jgi:hypothetical protein
MDLKGYRLWHMGKLDSTCRAPPRQRPLCAVEVGDHRVVRAERQPSRVDVARQRVPHRGVGFRV